MPSRHPLSVLVGALVGAVSLVCLGACGGGDAGTDGGDGSPSLPTVPASITTSASAAAARLPDPCDLFTAKDAQALLHTKATAHGSTLADLGIASRVCDYETSSLHAPITSLMVANGGADLDQVIAAVTSAGSQQQVADPAIAGADQTAELDDPDPKYPGVQIFVADGDVVLVATVSGDSVSESRTVALALVGHATGVLG